MKTSRLITGLVLALSISMAPSAIADEPTPVVATQEEIEAVRDAAQEAIDAAEAATEAALLAVEAAEAASAIALEARASADAANDALAQLDSDIKAFFSSMSAQLTTLAKTMVKVGKKLGVK